MPGSFFDSNIVLYSASADAAKVERATVLLGEGGFIRVQVLNEVANVARRKMGYDWQRTLAFLATVRSLVNVADVHLTDHDTARAVAQRHKLSIYDAVIVAVALRIGCDILFSEDMHHGLVVDDRLTIVNPFRD